MDYNISAFRKSKINIYKILSIAFLCNHYLLFIAAVLITQLTIHYNQLCLYPGRDLLDVGLKCN